MEVVLDRDAFLKGLQMVHNIVEPRQTLPILANVLLETETEAAVEPEPEPEPEPVAENGDFEPDYVPMSEWIDDFERRGR